MWDMKVSNSQGTGISYTVIKSIVKRLRQLNGTLTIFHFGHELLVRNCVLLSPPATVNRAFAGPHCLTRYSSSLDSNRKEFCFYLGNLKNFYRTVRFWPKFGNRVSMRMCTVNVQSSRPKNGKKPQLKFVWVIKITHIKPYLIIHDV